LSPLSFDRQKCISLLIRFVFFLAFSSSAGSATVSNLSLLPFEEPGIKRFKLAKDARFQALLGFGTDGPDNGPPNMSFPMVPVFQIVGPSKNPYPGTFCLPQVPLPANTTVNVGDNATIQVVETAIHGAALYSCVDITFANPEDVAEVNSSNCFNSTDITFNNVYSIGIGPSSSATRTLASASLLPLVFGLMYALL